MKTAFVRRSVVKFMPGERIEDAIEAAQRAEAAADQHHPHAARREPHAHRGSQRGLGPLRQGHRPGEGRRSRRAGFGEADAARLRPGSRGLLRVLRRVCSRAARRPATSSGSTWRARRTWTARSRSTSGCASGRSKVGIAIQAYLYRTEKDIEDLVALGSAIRLVKGAYLEPASVAFPKKSRRGRELLQARVAAPPGRQHEAGRAAPHRDARHPAAGAAAESDRRPQRLQGSLRVRHAVRHPDVAPAGARPAAASACAA